MENPKITIVRRLFEDKHISLQEMLILLSEEPSKYAVPLTDEQLQKINKFRTLIIE